MEHIRVELEDNGRSGDVHRPGAWPAGPPPGRISAPVERTLACSHTFGRTTRLREPSYTRLRRNHAVPISPPTRRLGKSRAGTVWLDLGVRQHLAEPAGTNR